MVFVIFPPKYFKHIVKILTNKLFSNTLLGGILFISILYKY